MPPRVIFKPREEGFTDLLSGIGQGYLQGQQLKRQNRQDTLADTLTNLKIKQLQQEMQPVDQSSIPVDPNSGQPVFVKKPGSMRDYVTNPLLPKAPTQVNLQGISDLQNMFSGNRQNSPLPAPQQVNNQQQIGDLTGKPAQGYSEGDIVDDVDDATGQVIGSYQVRNGTFQRI